MSAGDGDEICFARGAPFPKIRVVFPGWEPPESEALKALKSDASAELKNAHAEASAEEQRWKTRADTMLNWLSSIQSCKIEDEVRRIVEAKRSLVPPQLAQQLGDAVSPSGVQHNGEAQQPILARRTYEVQQDTVALRSLPTSALAMP